MAPTLEILHRIEATTPSLKFRFGEAAAGAGHYKETGKTMSESTIKLCEEADAILLGACGLPSVRYPDNTEIMPQVELRFIFDLYAGVRPARLIPGVPSPIVGADVHGIDFVLIRESTEGLFASMGKGVVTDDEARETLVVTRNKTERLFDFSLKLTERRKKRGRPGRLTLVDKANVFKAFNWQRDIFAERKAKFPEVKTDLLYVDSLHREAKCGSAEQCKAPRSRNGHQRGLPDRQAAGVGRDGDRLRGRADRDRREASREGDARAVRGRRLSAGALRARGEARGVDPE